MTVDELRALAAEGESASLEFKTSTGQRSDACQTLCAMLNGEGGHVLFGVRPGGDIVGQQVADRTMNQLADELARIDPAVEPVVHVVRVGSGLSVIAVRVGRGPLRPYAHRGRYFKRVATTTREMHRHEREMMLMERLHGVTRWENEPLDGWSVEDLDADEVRVTINEAVRRGRLDDAGSGDVTDILRRLSLVSRDGRLVRAAVVLFAREERLLPDFPQCRLRLARFRGRDRSEFVDHRVVYGHGFRLLRAAQRFLIDHLPVAGRVQAGLFEREDDPLYPPEALREALANAICHRDYAIGGGSVSIGVYDDRVEISSSGGLHFDLTVEDLFQPHESLPWNPVIARTFYLRGVIEQWGRGITKMVELLERAGLPRPEIADAAGALTVTFRPAAYAPPHRVPHDLTRQQREILGALANEGPMRLGALASFLGGGGAGSVDLRQVQVDLTDLRGLDLVGQSGRGRGSRWFLIDGGRRGGQRG